MCVCVRQLKNFYLVVFYVNLQAKLPFLLIVADAWAAAHIKSNSKRSKGNGNGDGSGSNNYDSSASTYIKTTVNAYLTNFTTCMQIFRMQQLHKCEGSSKKNSLNIYLFI